MTASRSGPARRLPVLVLGVLSVLGMTTCGLSSRTDSAQSILSKIKAEISLVCLTEIVEGGYINWEISDSEELRDFVSGWSSTHLRPARIQSALPHILYAALDHPGLRALWLTQNPRIVGFP